MWAPLSSSSFLFVFDHLYDNVMAVAGRRRDPVHQSTNQTYMMPPSLPHVRQSIRCIFTYPSTLSHLLSSFALIDNTTLHHDAVGVAGDVWMIAFYTYLRFLLIGLSASLHWLTRRISPVSLAGITESTAVSFILVGRSLVDTRVTAVSRTALAYMHGLICIRMFDCVNSVLYSNRRRSRQWVDTSVTLSWASFRKWSRVAHISSVALNPTNRERRCDCRRTRY